MFIFPFSKSAILFQVNPLRKDSSKKHTKSPKTRLPRRHEFHHAQYPELFSRTKTHPKLRISLGCFQTQQLYLQKNGSRISNKNMILKKLDHSIPLKDANFLQKWNPPTPPWPEFPFPKTLVLKKNGTLQVPNFVGQNESKETSRKSMVSLVFNGKIRKSLSFQKQCNVPCDTFQPQQNWDASVLGRSSCISDACDHFLCRMLRLLRLEKLEATGFGALLLRIFDLVSAPLLTEGEEISSQSKDMLQIGQMPNMTQKPTSEEELLTCEEKEDLNSQTKSSEQLRLKLEKIRYMI